MSVMSSRERVECALCHRDPDRTPLFEYVLLSPLADLFLGEPYLGDPSHWERAVRELGWRQAVRRNAEHRIRLAELLGHDLVYAVPVPAPPPRDPVRSVSPVDQSPAPSDPVEAVRRRNAYADSVAPQPNPDTLLIFRDLKEVMGERGLDLPLIAPAYAHGVWTDTDLLQTMVLAPDIAREHFRQATRRSMALVECYAEIGADLVGVGGDFAGNRPVISPAQYRQFILPEVREVTRLCHGRGMRAINASDGDLWPVLDDFLLGTGVDGYLEIDWGAGMDLGRLKARYGAAICFFGNLDCGSVLSFGSTDDVRKHVLDCLEAGMGSGGHVLCASNAITASVPRENYLVAVETYRWRFGLPPLRL